MLRLGTKWKEIVTLALPVVISKLSFTAMGLVDTAMVGRLGATEQAAVGIATTYMFTLYVFGLGIISVVNTFVAQSHGAGRPQDCGVALGHSLLIGTAIGALTLAVLLLSAPLFHAAGLSPAVADTGYQYLFWRVLGLPGVFWYWSYNGYLEGLGETRTPMRITLAANLINIGGDYALIFGPGPFPALGVEGAGMATAMSNLFMLACLVFVVHRPGSRFSAFGAGQVFSRIRRQLLTSMIRIGLPMGVQFFLEVGAFLVFSVMVGWVSDVALAAHQVTLRLWSVSFMTAWGISVAATTLVGRHQGEGHSDEAHAAGMRTVKLAVGVALAIGAIYVAIPGILASLFTNVAEVAAIATGLAYLCALNQLLDCVNIVAYGALKGAGDTRWPMWTVVITNWVFGVPLVYLLTISAGLGAAGAWLGMAIVLGFQATAMFLRFRGGKWRAIRLVDAGEPG
jgi:MATE family multidrug resistance protein